MTPTLMDFMAMLGIALMGACAQLFLKKASGAETSFIRTILNIWTISGITLMLACTLWTASLLRSLPLTVVLPVTSLIYIFVPLGARLLFNEKVSKRFWVGGFCLIVGIIICSYQ